MGEPTLHPSILDITAHAASIGLRPTVITHGMHLARPEGPLRSRRRASTTSWSPSTAPARPPARSTAGAGTTPHVRSGHWTTSEEPAAEFTDPVMVDLGQIMDSVACSCSAGDDNPH
jgi:hypothetical protein